MVALGRLANVAVSSAWQLTVALSELTMVAQGSQAQLRRIHREIEEASVSVFRDVENNVSRRLIDLHVNLMAYPVYPQGFEYPVILVVWPRAYSTLLMKPESKRSPRYPRGYPSGCRRSRYRAVTDHSASLTTKQGRSLICLELLKRPRMFPD